MFLDNLEPLTVASVLPFVAALSGAFTYAFFYPDKRAWRNVAQIVVGSTSGAFLAPVLAEKFGLTSLASQNTCYFLLGATGVLLMQTILRFVKRRGDDVMETVIFRGLNRVLPEKTTNAPHEETMITAENQLEVADSTENNTEK